MRVTSIAIIQILASQSLAQASVPSKHQPTLAACRVKLEMYEKHVIEQLAVLLHLDVWSSSSTPIDGIQYWRSDVQSYDASFSDRLASTITKFMAMNNIRSSGSTSTLVDVCGVRTRVGIDVAQAKFSSEPFPYKRLASGDDSAAILALLTNEVVEATILARVRSSAKDYVEAHGVSTKNDAQSANDLPTLVERFFKEVLIPLTKDLEVSVLLKLSLEPAKKEHENDITSSASIKNL